MTDEEITQMTLAMVHSGEIVDLLRRNQSRQAFYRWRRRHYDAILAPLVASVGVNVAKCLVVA